MNILTIGPWFMLGLGVVTVLGAVVFRTIHPKEGTPWGMLIFGVLLGGVGIWGPGFLKPYGEWIGNLSNLINNPGSESITTFIEGIEEGKMPEEIQKIGLNYIVDNPVPGVTDSILEDAIDRIPDDSPIEKVFVEALGNLRGRQAAADQLINAAGLSDTGTQRLRELDPAMRVMIIQRAERIGPSALQARGVNLDSIRALRPPPRVPRIHPDN